jgi:hypothetical protein
MMTLLSFTRDAALVLAFATGMMLASGPAAAEDSAPSPRWEPGNRTTSSLAGEVSRTESAGTADGVYGRFDGDLALAFGVGTELEATAGRTLLSASAHYYWMAGVYGAYRDALGIAPDRLSARRIGSFGVDLRPLFIPRWSCDWQSGPATLDLFLDSISLSAGAFFASVPDRERASRRGFEIGLGAGLPLSAHAAGPWLATRYSLRFPEAGPATGSAWLLLSWHFFSNTPISIATGRVH